MHNQENLQELINGLESSLQTLVRINAEALSQVPDEHKHLVKDAQKSMNDTLEAVKQGDLTKLNEIILRNANLSNI